MRSGRQRVSSVPSTSKARVRAVSGSNLFVTDAVSGQHASVNTAGALNVAEAGPKSLFYRGVTADVASFKQVIAAPPGRAMRNDVAFGQQALEFAVRPAAVK